MEVRFYFLESFIFWLIFYLCFGAVTNNEASQLEQLLETQFARYLVSNDPLDFKSADKVCNENGGKLLYVQNPQEFKILAKKLKSKKKFLSDFLLTSGVSFSNSTVNNLNIWTSNNESVDPSLEFHIPPGTFASGNQKLSSAIVRNRRSFQRASKDGKDCNCDCKPELPPPFPVPQCKKPTCDILLPPGPPCAQITPPVCAIVGTPKCSVSQQNCTVDCGPPCRIIEQPVCRVKESTKPRCRLEVPKCEQGAANCTIVAPGTCYAVQDPCTKQKADTCQPIVKPCKKSCADQECTTTQPPCETRPTQPPCQTTLPCVNPPTSAPCKMEERCRRKRSGDKVDYHCEMIPVCPNITNPSTGCDSVVTCPAAKLEKVCPPPVTSCTQPLASCLTPEICQSSVHLCLPPTYHCPPVRVICEQPKVHCEVLCKTEPEVICDTPETECSKPKMECPNAVVHCGSQVSTCEHIPMNCTTAIPSDCKEPTINCQEAVTCTSESNSAQMKLGGNSCSCSSDSCNENSGVPVYPPSSSTDTEIVDVVKTLCIAMRKEFGFKFQTVNCDHKFNFICKTDKEEVERGKENYLLKNLLF